MENTIIRVITKNSYGVDRVYPLNFKEPLYNLTGQKTLSGKQRQALKDLGFIFKIETKPI